MDLIKIGKHIAGKRKALGLTQKELAEKLGMSDKSVSKWECGICLPDVSTYIELCNILGISINEFLAGEDLRKEQIEEKAEINLLQIAKDSKKKQKSLQNIIWFLVFLIILLSGTLGVVFYWKVRLPQNYIEAVSISRKNIEMQTAERIYGADEAFSFRYKMTDKFKSLTFYITEYQVGKKISKSKIGTIDYEKFGSPKEGIIVVAPYFEKAMVRFIEMDEKAKFITELPVLQDVEARSLIEYSAVQMEEKQDIQYGKEQPLIALFYGKDGMNAIPIQDISSGDLYFFENDYIYYFSVEFHK